MSLRLHGVDDSLLDIGERSRRFEAADHPAVLAGKKLREVPLDRGLLRVVRIGLAKHLLQNDEQSEEPCEARSQEAAREP